MTYSNNLDNLQLCEQLKTDSVEHLSMRVMGEMLTSNWFKRHSDEEPSEEDFKFRRGQYFWHTLAAIGQAAARAVAQRVQVAEHTLRRLRVPPSMQDDLAFPVTVPSSDV